MYMIYIYTCIHMVEISTKKDMDESPMNSQPSALQQLGYFSPGRRCRTSHQLVQEDESGRFWTRPAGLTSLGSLGHRGWPPKCLRKKGVAYVTFGWKCHIFGGPLDFWHTTCKTHCVWPLFVLFGGKQLRQCRCFSFRCGLAYFMVPPCTARKIRLTTFCWVLMQVVETSMQQMRWSGDSQSRWFGGRLGMLGMETRM